MLDDVWGGSNLRPPLSWLQFAACDETVGFRPQLHAAAAIAAQTELRLPSFDKQKGCDLKSRPIIGPHQIPELGDLARSVLAEAQFDSVD